jgi:serine/threonine-protein kinase RsbW
VRKETQRPEETVSAPLVRRWLAVLSEPALRIIADADLAAPHLSRHLPADSRALRVLRRALTAWSRRLQVGTTQTDDILLGVSEAATNAIEHAYGGDAHDKTNRVLVLAVSDLTRKTAAVVVADTGHWRAPPVDPGHRGRGLSLMRAVTDQFHLHHDNTGTTVVLSWALLS